MYTKYSKCIRELRAAKIKALTTVESVGIINPSSQLDLEDEFYISQNRTVFNSKWVK
jgi:hypothetical protein